MKLTVRRLVEGKVDPNARYVAFEAIFDEGGWPIEHFLEIRDDLWNSLEVGMEVEVPDRCLG